MRLFPTLLLLLLLLPQAHAQDFEIGDEPIWTRTIFHTDQFWLSSGTGLKDKALIFSGAFRAHQSFRSLGLGIYDLSDDYEPFVEELPTGTNYWIRGVGGFGLTYTQCGGCISNLDPKDYLAQEILILDDIIYLPDRNNYSHRLTLDGEYLGKFPNHTEFLNDYLAEKNILFNGEPLTLPIETYGETWNSFKIMDEVIIFINTNQLNYDYRTNPMIIFNIKELAEKGENAKVARVGGGYNVNFIYENYVEVGDAIYKILPTPELVPTGINNPHDVWSHIYNNHYYSLHGSGYFLLGISKYPVYGLGFQRSYVGDEWMMYE